MSTRITLSYWNLFDFFFLVVPGSSGSDLTIIIGVVAALFVIALFVLSAAIIALIIKYKL